MGRILGIDFGLRRVGLALSDPLQIIATPFQTLQYRNQEHLIQQIKDLIPDKDVQLIVLGLPVGLRGQETIQTQKIRDFKILLDKKLNLPVVFQDERLSSVSARKDLIKMEVKTGHYKGRVDQTAAAIFLQQFLDTRNR
ncbi:MAG: Holliday junction resolvase RuvX [Fidelibacterota bacterium]